VLRLLLWGSSEPSRQRSPLVPVIDHRDVI